jgi:hypothetical protein
MCGWACERDNAIAAVALKQSWLVFSHVTFSPYPSRRTSLALETATPFASGTDICLFLQQHPPGPLRCRRLFFGMQVPSAESEDKSVVGGVPLSDFDFHLGQVPDIIMPDCFMGQFISSRGNEYFCEIDEEYLTDRFNLTGLNAEVPYYQYALDLITDVFDLDADDHLREQIEKSARHLYGLAHARYIVTTRGLAKMVCFEP